MSGLMMTGDMLGVVFTTGMILAILAAFAGGGALSYLKGSREHELGLKGLDLQEKGMKAQNTAGIRTSRTMERMGTADRKAAMGLRTADRIHAGIEKDKERDMMKELMQMQIVQSMLQSNERGSRPAASNEGPISLSALMR